MNQATNSSDRLDEGDLGLAAPAEQVVGGANRPPGEESPTAVVDREQETDVWWGSYSGWTMLPSFVGCLVLTVLIFWLVIRFLPQRDLVKLTVLGASSAVWAGQFIRWGLRIFSFNYRLTTRRLFQDRGFLYPDRQHIELADVAKVEERASRFERLLGLGKVYLVSADSAKAPLVLEGVRDPRAVANLIRKTAFSREPQACVSRPVGTAISPHPPGAKRKPEARG